MFVHAETLPLQLLEIINRGVPRPSDGQIRLRRVAPNTTMNIVALTGNQLHYAIPSLAIEGNNFVIHLSK